MHQHNYLFAFINDEFREDGLDKSSVVLEGSGCRLSIIGQLNRAENFVGMGFEEGNLFGEMLWVVPGAVEDKDCGLDGRHGKEQWVKSELCILVLDFLKGKFRA